MFLSLFEKVYINQQDKQIPTQRFYPIFLRKTPTHFQDYPPSFRTPPPFPRQKAVLWVEISKDYGGENIATPQRGRNFVKPIRLNKNRYHYTVSNIVALSTGAAHRHPQTML